MYSFHFGKLLPLYVAVIEHSSVPSPSVYFSLSPHFCLFPSRPASSLTSSIPSECWAPPSWHSDCSYQFHQIAIVHVFVMLNTIPLLICTSFSLVPPRLPSISPLISHTNSMCWSLYMFPSFSTCSFPPIPRSLNQCCRGCQSSLSPSYPTQHASTEMEGRMEGRWWIWIVGGVEHVESQEQSHWREEDQTKKIYVWKA